MGLTKAFVTETIEKEIVVKIECDLCGHRQKAENAEFDEGFPENTFMVQSWTAGFGSRFDMSTFEVSLCDACMSLLSSPSEEREVLKRSVASIHQARAEMEEC